MAYLEKVVKAPTSRAIIERLLDDAIAAQLSENQPRGCFMLTNSVQSGGQASTMRIEVQRRAERTHQVLVDRFVQARADNDLPASLDPEGLARLLTSVMQGIASLGAAGAGADQLHALADSVLTLWPDASTARYRNITAAG